VQIVDEQQQRAIGGEVAKRGQDGLEEAKARLLRVSRTSGALSVVADTSTAIPDGTGSFVNFDSRVALSDSRMAFIGAGSDGQGSVYAATSGSGDDDLHGGPGDDTLRGGAGSDTLEGDEGLDKVYGDAGSDSCTGEIVRTCDEVR
jgi:Ca2+-binding RTX toxin-like protein